MRKASVCREQRDTVKKNRRAELGKILRPADRDKDVVFFAQKSPLEESNSRVFCCPQ